MSQRQGTVRVVNMRAKITEKPGDIVVNTTSRSAEEWSRGLSPFVLGPVGLYSCDESRKNPTVAPYGVYIAENVENAWQYAKVYPCHTDDNDEPVESYYTWATAGWSNPTAVRYPMGKGAKPLYSLWNGEHLGYIAARKRIYCPLYAAAVEGTPAYAQLRRVYAECVDRGTTLYLRDFDGYDQKGSTFDEVLNNPARKMGHAFVLAMMLTGDRAWVSVR